MRRIVPLSLLAAAMLAVSPAASAQMVDNRGLYDRIDRLERDIQTLQAQVARGGAGSTTVVTSPALGGGTKSETPEAGPVAVQLTDRVDQLEEQVRQLTGKVEEANFKAGQTQQQLDRMQADIDLRFRELQGGAGAPGAAAAGAAAAGATTAAATPPAAAGKGGMVGAAPGSNSAGNAGPAPGPQTLGSLPAGQAAAAAPAAPAAPANLPQIKDPQALYDDAYARLQKGDYPGAEAQFNTFITKFPNHQLASNAAYWTADIAFNRKDYRSSAKMFLEAYQKYQKSTKAPDMLYKAGASFARLDPPKKNEACTAFKLLFEGGTPVPDHVKRDATAERKKLACP